MSEVKEKKLPDIKAESESHKCQVKQALYLVSEFLAGPMCGKCFPCEMGTYEAKIRLTTLVDGNGSEQDIKALKKIADEMSVTSRCKKGKDVAKYILEWLDSDVFKEHTEKHCPTGECLALSEYRVIADECIFCGKCQDVCKDNAVVGQTKVAYKSGDIPFKINQARCTRCGECIKVCPTSAIEVISLKSAINEEVTV